TTSNTSWIGGYRNIQIDSSVILDLEYANHHPDQHTMIFSRSNPSVAITGSDGGVHRTEDIMSPSVSWRSLDNGYATSQFYSVAIDHLPGSQMVIGGLQDNGTWRTSSADGHAPWRLSGTGDGSYCQIADGGRE